MFTVPMCCVCMHKHTIHLQKMLDIKCENFRRTHASCIRVSCMHLYEPFKYIYYDAFQFIVFILIYGLWGNMQSRISSINSLKYGINRIFRKRIEDDRSRVTDEWMQWMSLVDMVNNAQHVCICAFVCCRTLHIPYINVDGKQTITKLICTVSVLCHFKYIYNINVYVSDTV